MSDVNILIVEDERIIARELQADLDEMGYAVTGMVNSGEKAIQLALEKKPDLVLMDIRLHTQMDGIEAASQIFARFKRFWKLNGERTSKWQIFSCFYGELAFLI